jgi:hypothetical protein
MDRRDLDVARLAAALIVTEGGRHSAGARQAAYAQARELYAALEDAEITEASLAMAMHGAWCSGTRSADFHGWSYHRPESGELYEALSDTGLDAKLTGRASEEDAREA